MDVETDPTYSLWQQTLSQLPGASVLVFDHDLHYQVCAGGDLKAQPFNQNVAPGKSLYEAMPLAYVAAFEGPYREALAGQTRTVEFAFAGQVYTMTVCPLVGAQDQIAGGMVVSRLSPAAVAPWSGDTRYQALYHQTNDAVFIFDLNGHLLEWNRRAAEMLGYDSLAFANLPIRDVVPPGELPDSDNRLHSLLAGEEVPVYERHFRHKDGSLLTVEVNLALIRDEAGVPACFLSVVRDVTARKRVEQELQHREMLLNTVIDSVLSGIMVLRAVRDADGQIIDLEWLLANRASAKFLGHNDLVGKRLLEVLPQTRGDGVYERCVSVIETGEPISYEYHYVLDGESHWFYIIGVRLDQVDGMVATFRSITANRNAEEALRRSEERFRLVAKVTSDGIYDWDMMTNSDWHSEGYRQAFDTGDAHTSEIAAWHERIHPDDRERVISSQLAAIQGDATSWTDEYRMRKRDGHYACVADRAYILRDGRSGLPTRLVGAVTDITQRRAAQQQALELTLQKEKVQFLTNFISAVSHDFRTPLAIINTSIYLMVKSDEIDVRQRHAQKLEQQVWRVEQLVDGLLTMAWLDREDALDFEMLDLNTIIEYVDTRKRGNCDDKHLALYVDLDSSLPLICGDRDWLNRAFLNIMENAIEHTQAGNSITMRTYRRDGYVVASVQDTGTGISEAQLDNIFEPLYRPEPHRPLSGGAGLGLSIVHKIVEQHHGRVDIRSTPGTGTTLEVFLPIEGAQGV